jgi:1-acyl-sn-glycerol-3-phosphate acyltransferase
MENIPATGSALIAISHSLATYDGLLLGAAIHQQVGRLCRGLGDRLIFKTPLLADWALRAGVVEGSHPSGMQLLEEGNLVLMAPGGMLESLRPYDQRYQICWDRRLGFVRLAVRARVPIILAACPHADDIYRVYGNPLTPLVYQRFKLPLPVARGLGFSAIPRPVRLTHYVSEPIDPPEIPEGETFEAGIEEFHAEVVKKMRELMARALRED